jgi:hypothetical protein
MDRMKSQENVPRNIVQANHDLGWRYRRTYVTLLQKWLKIHLSSKNRSSEQMSFLEEEMYYVQGIHSSISPQW